MKKVYSFEKINISNVVTDEFNASPQKSVFTTVEWISYIIEDSKAEPVILRITCGDDFVGYFSGLKIKKLGVKIVASPFNGWSTCYMGLDLIADTDRIEILDQVKEWLYKNEKCMYIEITDRNIDKEDAQKNGLTCLPMHTLELDVNKTDEELFKVFKTDARNYIRQFERRGATIEKAIPNDEFAAEYYEQLIDVFAKQGLVPTYSLAKVKCLLKHLSKTENVLCLRVRNPEGKSIATSVFFGYKSKFFFWGGASFRGEQHYRPNEYMIWTAIKHWRDKGCAKFDMVGVRDYKKKFGSQEVEYVKIVYTKFKILLWGRNFAKDCYGLLLRIKGILKRKK